MNNELKLRLIVFFSIAFILISFLGLHGTISSGYHFVDNHEVVQINKDVSDANGNLFNVLSTWVKNDLGGRFRPIYMIDNVLVYSTFHGDFFKISLYHTLLIIFIAFFLFLSLRKTGFHLFEALIFPVIALTGAQSAIWWRLGPNESIGMWYLSLSLLFMIYAIKSKNRNAIFRILFCISTVLMMLCKESFLLLSPAIILSYLSLEKLQSESNSWSVVLKKHRPEIISILTIFIGCIVFILKKVNTENLGYAGIEGVPPMAYLITLGKLFSEGGIGIASFIIFCISGVLSYIRNENKRKTISCYILVLLITLCIIIPQSFLYAKSGIFERYFLPGMLAWAFMLAFSLKNLKEVIIRTGTKKQTLYFLFVEIVMLFSLIVPRLLIVSREASKFTLDGKEINMVLSMISDNIDPNETIVFVADPISDFERTISFRRYLGSKTQLTKMFTYPVTPINPDAFGQSLIKDYFWTMGGEEMHYKHIADKKSVNLFVLFPFLRDKGDSIITSLGYDLNEFMSYKTGNYQLYFRNKKNKDLFYASYISQLILPVNKNESIYKESAFFPERYIKTGDSLEIIIKPSKEIRTPMVAYVILLDLAHPENIAVHQQISGQSEIKISKLILKDIEKPWLIYRNWGKEQAIPSAVISLRVKNSSQLHIPIL